MDGERSRHLPQLHRPHRPRSRSSRSPSQDSAGSKDIDELLIEASTDDVGRFTRSPRQMLYRGHPDMYPNMNYRPDSPTDYRYPHHSHPRGGANSLPNIDSPGGPPGVSVMSGPAMHPDTSGPLERPGQVQTYQTHIFAPPVTGAPAKKRKSMEAGASSGAQGWYFTADCLLAAYAGHILCPVDPHADFSLPYSRSKWQRHRQYSNTHCQHGELPCHKCTRTTYLQVMRSTWTL